MTERPTEAEVHRTVADYLRFTLPDDSWWTTFPLGGGGRARGQSLKRAGTVKGTPDILVIFRGRAYWFELKTATGRVSPEQREQHDRLFEVGSFVAVIRSLADVDDALDRWAIPRSARVAA